MKRVAKRLVQLRLEVQRLDSEMEQMGKAARGAREGMDALSQRVAAVHDLVEKLLLDLTSAEVMAAPDTLELLIRFDEEIIREVLEVADPYMLHLAADKLSASARVKLETALGK